MRYRYQGFPYGVQLDAEAKTEQAPAPAVEEPPTEAPAPVVEEAGGDA